MPPIQAVVGYIFVPQGWVGPVGMSYTLSYPSGGGSGGIYIQVNDPDLNTEIGCHGTASNDENLEAAQTAYDDIRSGFIALDNDPTTDSWTNMQANLWLWANDYTGATYTHEFPNGTTGDFTVGPLIGDERALTKV